MILNALAATLALIADARIAQAHHSTAQYDFGKSVTIEGTVKQVRFGNPHLHLVLEVSDANGTRQLEFEGRSMNQFYRAGWRKDMVKPGDKVVVTVAPVTGRAEGGFVSGIKTADGHQF